MDDQLTLKVRWLDPPSEDEAVGPERATWGSLEIAAAGSSLTQWRTPGERGEQHAVVGGMAGIADWIVECWVDLLYGGPTPFPKTELGQDNGPPSARQVLDGARVIEAVNVRELGRWEHRHRLGHGNSDLALPSVWFVPEPRQIGVYVLPQPAVMGGSVSFLPKQIRWTIRAEIESALSEFVTLTIARARETPDAVPWAEWLAGRWSARRAEANDHRVKESKLLGEQQSNYVDKHRTELGDLACGFVDVVFDVGAAPGTTLDGIVGAFGRAAKAGLDSDARWAQGGGHVFPSLPVYEQGYRHARALRKALALGIAPITDLADIADSIGIDLGSVEHSAGRFRTLSLAVPGRRPQVLRASDGNIGVAPTRFAIAAALGRLIADGAGPQAPFAAATGDYSRVVPTQRANAFAAEFLLPQEAIRTRDAGDLATLAEDYGISRSAAGWHAHNATESPGIA